MSGERAWGSASTTTVTIPTALQVRLDDVFHVKHGYLGRMARVLVTGMSGVGKSSVVALLGEGEYRRSTLTTGAGRPRMACGTWTE